MTLRLPIRLRPAHGLIMDVTVRPQHVNWAISTMIANVRHQRIYRSEVVHSFPQYLYSDPDLGSPVKIRLRPCGA